jgi:hypothetical protein
MKGKTQNNREGAQQAAAKHEGQTGGRRQGSEGSKQTGKELRGTQRGK